MIIDNILGAVAELATLQTVMLMVIGVAGGLIAFASSVAQSYRT